MACVFRLLAFSGIVLLEALTVYLEKKRDEDEDEANCLVG